MVSEKRFQKIFSWVSIICLQVLIFSCNFNVPKGPEDLGLFINLQKTIFASTVSEANITVTGSVKDASGNLLSGGILSISNSSRAGSWNRAPVDTKVYTDTSGNFTMNVYVGSFTIQVSRSDGTPVGSFALKVTGATETPKVSSPTGLQVIGISAAPVGTTTPISESLKLIFTGLPQVINEGQSTIVQIKLSRAITSNETVTLTLSNSAITLDGLSSKTLTFSAANATTNQSFTLEAVSDSNTNSETIVLTAQATSIEPITFTLTTLDTTSPTPVAFLSIPNGTPSSITEGNSSTIGVIMTGSVTKTYSVSITSSNPSAISVSPSSIEISPNNFSVSKQIVLTANQDENLVSETVTITLSSPELSQVEFTVNATEDDYILSGTLTGLTGTLVLTNNNGYDTVSLTSNGNFTFPKSASTYAVTVQTQPIGQYCSIGNGTGTATSNVSNVTVTCLSCSGTTVSRNWGTFTDCNDGTVKLVVTPGTWGGATYTAKTLYYSKCTHGQTYSSATNTCSGSDVPVKFCTVADNNVCNGGSANSPVSSGALYDACSTTILAGKSWRVPTKDEMRLLISCNSTTQLPGDNGYCSSGNSSPSIISLFTNTVASDYWTASTYNTDVTKAWVIQFNSGGVSFNSKTSNQRVRCISEP